MNLVYLVKKFQVLASLALLSFVMCFFVYFIFSRFDFVKLVRILACAGGD